MKFVWVLCILVASIVVIGILPNLDDGTYSTKTTSGKARTTSAISVKCDLGTPVSGSFFVKGQDINFRSGPGINHDPIVNKKATSILGKTIYRTLWPSMVLKGYCETEEWLQAKIVEADGKLANWEIGWVKKKFVSETASSDFLAGLIWNVDSVSTFTAEEKRLVKEGALKALSDEPNCGKIITGYRSGSRKGAYYVTCTAKNNGPPFNIWFTPSDVQTGGKLRATEAYPEMLSSRACEMAIEARVTHPSTLDIHHFIGHTNQVHNNGNRTVIYEFTVKNSFGLETPYRAQCLIQPDGSLEIAMTEVQ